MGTYNKTWQVWICWGHLKPNTSSPWNPSASSGTPLSLLGSTSWLLYKRDCKALKMPRKDILNQRQYESHLGENNSQHTKERVTIFRQVDPSNTEGDITEPSEWWGFTEPSPSLKAICTSPTRCTKWPIRTHASEDKQRTLQILHSMIHNLLCFSSEKQRTKKSVGLPF